MRAALALAASLALAQAAAAHPHAVIEQQLHVSLDEDGTLVEWLIMPSAGDGGAIFDHLDADGSGVLEPGEREAFAATLLAATRLQVDGAPARLRVREARVPDRASLAAAAAPIRVSASWQGRLARCERHEFVVGIDHAVFDAHWHIQPFLSPALARGSRTAVQRKRNAQDITVTIAPAADCPAESSPALR